MLAYLASFRSGRPVALFVILLGLLSSAAGCQQWSVHSLEELAIASLNEEEAARLKADLQGVTADDRTPAGLEKAAAALAMANAQAPNSSVARAAQAVVIGRLFQPDVSEPSAAWLTPELAARLDDAFIQTDNRLRTEPADLVAVMVWAQAGTALNKSTEIRTLLTRAKSDPELKDLVRKDDPTRERLYTYSACIPVTEWWMVRMDVLYRDPPENLGEILAKPFVAAMLIPFGALLMIHFALGGRL